MSKKLGQVFLANAHVARAEAEHAHGKRVLEIGPGRGILTRELCRNAKSVVAVEKDKRLYDYLWLTLKSGNLRLLNADFFRLSDTELDLDGIDILIANIPYNLSSKTVGWIIEKGKEAVLCMQKEFVEHMLAGPGTRKYSKLSVISALRLSVTEIMPVPRSYFFPVPRVDSEVVYIRPKTLNISRAEENAISCLMQHKKKRLKNAIEDSRLSLGIERNSAAALASAVATPDERVFKISPERLLTIARQIVKESN